VFEQRSIFVTTPGKAKVLQKEEKDRAKVRAILEKSIPKTSGSTRRQNDRSPSWGQAF
jgi:hypothetical protein